MELKSDIDRDSSITVKNKLGRVGVLMGGPSAERDISLKSGKAVCQALESLVGEVVDIDIQSDDMQENIRLLKSKKIDCAFLALHGCFGEDGQIQEILDGIGIPYTGSGMLASKLAMDKIYSRNIFQIYGLAVPQHKIFDKYSYNANCLLQHKFAFPLVVKPVAQGSSIGLSIVDNEKELSDAIELAFIYDDKVLVEEYISGREVTVGILDDKALPVIEIIPKNKFFDYEAKYQSGMTDYVVPATLEKETSERIQSIAVLAHKLLGCSGCSRVDMILNKDNIPYVLEVNTIPGLTSTSLLPKAAKSVGIEFGQLCIKLLELAYEKK